MFTLNTVIKISDKKISLNTLKSSRSERKIIGLTRVKVRPSVDYLPYMSSSVFIPQDWEKSLSTFSALGTFLMRILSFKYIYRDFYTAIRFLKTKIRYLLSIACNKFHNLLPSCYYSKLSLRTFPSVSAIVLGGELSWTRKFWLNSNPALTLSIPHWSSETPSRVASGSDPSLSRWLSITGTLG